MSKRVVNLGLYHDDLNYKLLSFIEPDIISRLPLLDFQIDQLANYLNWDILSSKPLDGWIFVKYKHRIDWSVFLQNGHPKEINYLLDVKDKLSEHQHLFFNTRIKKQYYNHAFLSAFPEYVDWNWCAKNMKLSDFVLLHNWNKFNIGILSKYQTLSSTVLIKHKYNVIWKYVCRHRLEESLMRKLDYLMVWDVVCKYQKLSELLIEDYRHILSTNKKCMYAICRYQKLSEQFITTNIKWLDLETIYKYQNLSIDYIRENISTINLEILSTNIHYNKPNCIQILKSGSSWYIIDPPYIQTSQNVFICSVEG